MFSKVKTTSRIIVSRLRPSRNLGRPGGRELFRWVGDPFKHRILDLAQVAFLAGQVAQNEFAVPDEPFKHLSRGQTSLFSSGQATRK